MKSAIGPGTENFSRLNAGQQMAVTDICAKDLSCWSNMETAFIASMFTMAVLNAILTTPGG